jgi:hypothetical protein
LLPGVFPASAQVSCSLTKLPWAPRALLIAMSKFFFLHLRRWMNLVKTNEM